MSKWSGQFLLKCPGCPQWKHKAEGITFPRARSMSMGTGLPGIGTRWAFGNDEVTQAGRMLADQLTMAAGDW